MSSLEMRDWSVVQHATYLMSLLSAVVPGVPVLSPHVHAILVVGRSPGTVYEENIENME